MSGKTVAVVLWRYLGIGPKGHFTHHTSLVLGTFEVIGIGRRVVADSPSSAIETSEFLEMTTTALDLPGTMPRTRALKE